MEVTGNQREALKEQRDSYSKLEQQKVSKKYFNYVENDHIIINAAQR